MNRTWVEERGVVLEGGSGTARVRIPRSGECGECSGCRLSERGDFVITGVADPVGVRPGDLVKVRTEGAAPLKALLLLFVFPLALLATGYAAGSALPPALGIHSVSAAPGIIMAALFFFGAFGLLHVFTRGRAGASERSSIVEVLHNKSSAGA